MRVDEELVVIIGHCLTLDIQAEEIYQALSQRFEEPEMRSYWQTMALDEQEHVEYWKELLELARKGMVPQVFDKPYEIRKQLESLILKNRDVVGQCATINNAVDAFRIAYQLEFNILHPAFSSLFHFVRIGAGESSPWDSYEKHLSSLSNHLARFGAMTPDLDFIGEMVSSLWNRNCDLVLQAHIDPLTEVHNRRGFFHVVIPLAHLAQRMHYNVAIMMVDIDHFRTVNEQHGHLTGDSLLTLIAHCVKSQVRRSDAVGRYGGEEFIVFLINAEKEYLGEISERMRQHVEDITRDRIPVTVSIGISYDNLEGDVEEQIDRLVKEADDYLSQAKKAGRNKVVMKQG